MADQRVSRPWSRQSRQGAMQAGTTNCNGLFDNDGPSETKLLSHYLNRNSRTIKKKYAQFPLRSLKYPSCSELVRCRGDAGRQGRGCRLCRPVDGGFV